MVQIKDVAILDLSLLDFSCVHAFVIYIARDVLNTPNNWFTLERSLAC